MIILDLHQTWGAAPHQYVLELGFCLVVFRIHGHFMSKQLKLFSVWWNEYSQYFVWETWHVLLSNLFYKCYPIRISSMLKRSARKLVAFDFKDFEFIDWNLNVVRVKLVSLEVWVDSELNHLLLILLLLERVIMLSSKIFLISLLNLNVLIDLNDRCCLLCKSFSVSLRHRFFIILKDLHSSRLWYLNYLQVMCPILQQLLKFVCKHFMINNNHDIGLKLADSFGQTLSSPIILWSKAINDASTCKCFRIGWGYKTFQFLFINVHYCSILCRMCFICGFNHVLLIK